MRVFNARIVAATALMVAWISSDCQAAFVYSFAGSTYVQNFDSLASTGSGITWTDDGTIPDGGWYSSRSTYNAGTGSSTTGSLYSFGIAGTNLVTDRALGSVASGTTGTIQYGVVLQNTTGITLTSFDVGYTGEHWRRSGALSAITHSLTVDYRISAALGTLSDAATSIPSLQFDTTTFTPAGALDGNAAANREVFSPLTIAGSWAPNHFLWIRWTDVNDADNDNGLAIDDFSFSAQAVPEPSSAAGLLMAGIGAMMHRRWRGRRSKRTAA